MDAAKPSACPQLLVGTAGHIDHGKSRLVQALTGVDPDRLPEEKARGMTIDLGFAHARIEGCDVWFVDVPGHERFIRNMVAGATGVDVALLVVAADDSVMPQTREHAEVLKLLGVERCVVAISKMDLVDDEWADAVELEVRELLGALGLHVVQIVRTSAETRRGLDELRAVLAACARSAQTGRGGYTWFRLPIDRAFTVAGRGTVVTGSVMHGSVSAGDELQLWPAGRTVRVRDLQAHHEHRDSAVDRMRLALNLAGVARDEVRRGCELAAPGYLEPSRCMDVYVALLRMPGKALRRVLRLRLHLATSEVLAELRLTEQPQAPIVREQFGQLRLREPVVAAWGQRFILRDEAGTRTLGGGTVLRPVARPWSIRRPVHEQGLEALRSGARVARLEETLRDQEWPLAGPRAVATRAGLPDETPLPALLSELQVNGRIVALAGSDVTGIMHREPLQRVAERVVQRVRRAARDNPRWTGIARREWSGWMPRACPQRLRVALAEWVLTHGDLVEDHGFIRPQAEQPDLPAEDRRLYAALLEEIERGGFQPPTRKALSCRNERNARRVDELLDLATARGDLRRIADGMWLHRRCWDELVRRVTEAIRSSGPLTVAQIRNLLNSSRKYVVPLVERLDAEGITRRVGDRRTLGASANESHT